MQKYDFGIKPIKIPRINEIKKLKKRKSVRTSDRKHLLDYQDGKCGMCEKSFKQMGVRSIVHHKNENRADGRIVNLMLLCPNCHDKLHPKKKKSRKKGKKKSSNPLDDLIPKITYQKPKW